MKTTDMFVLEAFYSPIDENVFSERARAASGHRSTDGLWVEPEIPVDCG